MTPENIFLQEQQQAKMIKEKVCDCQSNKKAQKEITIFIP
jgi:hypothetical protein